MEKILFWLYMNAICIVTARAAVRGEQFSYFILFLAFAKKEKKKTYFLPPDCIYGIFF